MALPFTSVFFSDMHTHTLTLIHTHTHTHYRDTNKDIITDRHM